ncbi:hypothetical protein KEM56_006588 [Ascosphaera pollenicola]|nr:hypothetical protein KEM56_006588 [Ascosphaera pollenicola]
MASLHHESRSLHEGVLPYDAAQPFSYEEQYADPSFPQDLRSSYTHSAISEDWQTNAAQTAIPNPLSDPAVLGANAGTADGHSHTIDHYQDPDYGQKLPMGIPLGPMTSLAYPDYAAVQQQTASDDSAVGRVLGNVTLTAEAQLRVSCGPRAFDCMSDITYCPQETSIEGNPQILLSGADSPCQNPTELQSGPVANLFDSVEEQSGVDFELHDQDTVTHAQAAINNQLLQPVPWVDPDFRADDEDPHATSSQPLEDGRNYHKQVCREEPESHGDLDAFIQSPRERLKELNLEDKFERIDMWRKLSPDDGFSQNHRRAKSMSDLASPQQDQEVSSFNQAFCADSCSGAVEKEGNRVAEFPGPLSHQWTSLEPREEPRRLPPTSGNAMQWFESLAQETASLSIAATWGSRRLSDSEIGSVRGSNLAVLAARDRKQRDLKCRELTKRDGLMKGLSKLKRRASQTKRKLSVSHRHPNEDQEHQQAHGLDEETCTRKDSKSSTRTGSEKGEHPADDNGGGRSVGSRVRRLSAHLELRKRSRSTSARDSNCNLHSLLKKYGGVPGIMYKVAPEASITGVNVYERQGELTSPKMLAPVSDPDHHSPSSDGEEHSGEIIVGHGNQYESTGHQGQSPSFDNAFQPTLESFMEKILRLNPMIQDLAPFLTEQLAHEQVKRYNRLSMLRKEHNRSSKCGRCPSGHYCVAQGGSAKPIGATFGQQESSGVPGYSKSDHPTKYASSLPSMVPPPPVDQFPVELECTFCFKVKKLLKPSDWTKHVHGDLRPFTCTFNCSEPTAFKRKADWIRHENERHRHLEWWLCDRQNCGHICYRRDNFLQHLAREHRLLEGPRQKVLKNRNPTTNGQTELSSKEIDRLVDSCHRQSSSLPQDEKCRFCGDTFSEWKDLLTHVSDHLLCIAMPTLKLIERADHIPNDDRQPIAHEETNQRYTVVTDTTSPPTHNHTEASNDPMTADTCNMVLSTDYLQPSRTGNNAQYELPEQDIQPRSCISPEAILQGSLQSWFGVPTTSGDAYPFPNMVDQSTESFDMSWAPNMSLPFQTDVHSQTEHSLPYMRSAGNSISYPPTQRISPWYDMANNQSPEMGLDGSSAPN